MSLVEIFVTLFVFVFVATEKDVKKLKKLTNTVGKSVKKIKKEINTFLTKTLGLSTKPKTHNIENIFFVENDFTTKQITFKQHQLKPNKNNK